MTPETSIPNPRLFLAIISALYIGVAIWVRMFYPWFHYSVTLGLVAMGSALFFLANIQVFFGVVGGPFGTAVILGLFTAALVCAVWSIRVQVALVTKYREQINQP